MNGQPPFLSVIGLRMSRAAERIGAGTSAAEQMHAAQAVAARRAAPEPALPVVIASGIKGIQP
jgi:hypothetical protein